MPPTSLDGANGANGTIRGTIRFRSLPAHRLPAGPVSVRGGPNGTIRWTIDEGQIDPLIGDAFVAFSQGVLDSIYDGLNPRPTWVRVHRDSSLGGSVLLSADFSTCIDVLVPIDLMTAVVAHEIGRHGTEVLQHLLRTMPVIGQNSQAVGGLTLP